MRKLLALGLALLLLVGYVPVDAFAATANSMPAWLRTDDSDTAGEQVAASEAAGSTAESADSMPAWLRTPESGAAGSGNTTAGDRNNTTAGSTARNENTTAAESVAASQSGTQGIGVTGVPWLTAIRYGDSSEHLRIVLDMSQLPEYKVVKENNDTRLVITMTDVNTLLKAAPAVSSNVLKDIILANYGSGTLQLIVDMPLPFPTNVYTLQKPDRLVIDIQKDYEDRQQSKVADGLDYTKYTRFDNQGMLTAYVLEMDPAKFNLELALAGGSISAGRATVSRIARDNDAVAAINASYFNSDGTLIGNTRINGQTAGTTYYTRASLGLLPDGSFKLAPSSYSGAVVVKDKTIYLSGVNCPRGANNTILYNSLFGSRTGTNQYGMEYTIKDGKVIAINQSNSVIPEGAQVLSLHGTAQEAFAGVKVGDEVTIAEHFGTELDAATTIIGAGPELLQDGKLNVTSASEQFARDVTKGRAPRTAVGIKADGSIMLLVIDGRQSHSIGATLAETGRLLQHLGAKDGFNLDGGGSSAMVVQGQLVSSPSDGRERAVGSAIILTEKGK